MRQALREEFARIEQAMEEELPVTRPAASRSSHAARWACGGRLPCRCRCPTGYIEGMRPYVRPLVRTRDEHDRFVIALLSEQLSRYFVSQIGQVQEVFDVKGVNVRRMAVDRDGPKDRHDGSVAEALGGRGTHTCQGSRTGADAVRRSLPRAGRGKGAARRRCSRAWQGDPAAPRRGVRGRDPCAPRRDCGSSTNAAQRAIEERRGNHGRCSDCWMLDHSARRGA